MSKKQNTLTLEAAKNLFEEGVRLGNQAKFDAAIQAFEQSSEIYKVLGEWSDCVKIKKQGIYFLILQGKYAVVEKLLNELLQLAEEKLGKTNQTTLDCYNSMAHCFWKQGAYNRAIEVCKKTLKIGLPALGEGNPAIGNAYNNLSIAYTCKGYYEKALQYSFKYLQISTLYMDETRPAVASIYMNIAAIYSEMGNLEKALPHLQKALYLFQKIYSAKHPAIAAVYQNMGIVYSEMADYTQALKYFQKSLALRLEMYGKRHPDVLHTYNSLAPCLLEKGDLEEGHRIIEEALPLAEQLFGEMHPLTALQYTHLGRYHFLKNEQEKALAAFHKSLGIKQKIMDNSQITIATNYFQIGKCYLAEKEYKTCLQYLQFSLQSLCPDFQAEDPYLNPPPDSFYTSQTILLQVLELKGKVWETFYLQTQSIEDLQAAYDTYHRAILFVESIQKGYKTGNKDFSVADTAQQICEKAIAVGLQLQQLTAEFDPNAVFQFVERSKAMMLFATLKDSEAKLTSHIPPQKLEEEQSLKVELNFLEKQIAAAKGKVDSDAQNLQELQNQRFNYLQKYEKLIHEFEADYPEYYLLKYDLKTIEVRALQSHLDNSTAFVEYFVGEKHLYIFHITHSNFGVEVVDLASVLQGDTLKDLVEDYKAALNDPINQELYIEVAFELYELLIAPIEVALEGKKELLIVPDGVLSQIPFEALLTAMPEVMDTAYMDLPYLLLQHNVRYQYSATLWQHIQERKIKQSVFKKGFVGFAPVVYDDEMEAATRFMNPYFEKEKEEMILRGMRYAALPHSESEVQNIANLLQKQDFETQMHLRENATVKDFVEAVNGKALQFVHIAAHGVYDAEHPEQSGIVFSPNLQSETFDEEELKATDFYVQTSEYKVFVDFSENGSMLYISDTYTLDLSRIDLVVLSCCETGLGKWAKGEGTIAMNRGFLYAGANHVIYTLFKVYDKASSQLTQSLYENILEGKTYSQALRIAKLQLIQNRMAPKAWAGYVLLG